MLSSIFRDHLKLSFTIESLFSFGIYVACGAACMSGLRLTPGGPTILFDEGGYPFLYEVGILLVLIATFLRIFRGIPPLSQQRIKALWGLSLFYLPIFTSFLLQSRDWYQFVGGGQLRVQLFFWLLGMALILNPPTRYTIKKAMVLVVIGGLTNGLYALSCFLGFLDPIYNPTYRISGQFRYAGFFQFPAHLGILSAIIIVWSLCMPIKINIRIAFILVGIISIFISDSRTAMLATLTTFILFLISRISISKLLLISAICFVSIIGLLSIFTIPTDVLYQNQSRIESVFSTISIWYNNPILGIPWGTFGTFNTNLMAVSPHDLLLVSLLYGGIITFVCAITVYIWLFRIWFRISSSSENYFKAFVYILLVITISALFEQVLQNALFGIIFMISWSSIVNQTFVSYAIPGSPDFESLKHHNNYCRHY